MARTPTGAIGEMQDRIVIQSKSTGAGAVTWTTVDTVWASVRPLSAGEGLQTEAVRSTVQYEVTIRYRADVTPVMRLSWTPYLAGSAKALQILGVRIAPSRDHVLLDCAEVA